MLALARKSELSLLFTPSVLFGEISSVDKRVRTNTRGLKQKLPSCEVLVVKPLKRTLWPIADVPPRKQRESYHKNRPHSGTSWFRESRGPERSGCSRQQHTSVCCSRIWTQSVRPHGSGTLSKWRGERNKMTVTVIKLVSFFFLFTGWLRRLFLFLHSW